MISLINSYFFAILEPLIIFLTLNSILPQKYNKKVIHGFIFAASIVTFFSVLYLVSQFNILERSIVLITLSTIISFFLFDVKFEVRLFFLLVSFELSLLADSIFGNAFSFLVNNNILVILEMNELESFLFAFIAKMIFVFFAFIFSKFSKKFVFNISRKQWFMIDFIMAIIYGLILWFLYISPTLQEFVNPMQMSLVTTGFVFVFVLVVYFFREVSIFQKKEAEAYSALLTNTLLESEIKAIQASSASVKKLKHDINNHLICIERLSEKANNIEVVRYCKSLIDVDAFSDKKYINHDVINALIDYKIQLMGKLGIKYKLELEDIYDIHIDSKDLTGVLSNLIDNAIEASKKINTEDTEIIIKICCYKSYLLIYIKNKFNLKLNVSRNRFKTTKEDSSNHGFGIDIVNDIVKKYNGVFNQYPEGEYFSSLVMLSTKNK